MWHLDCFHSHSQIFFLPSHFISSLLFLSVSYWFKRIWINQPRVHVLRCFCEPVTRKAATCNVIKYSEAGLESQIWRDIVLCLSYSKWGCKVQHQDQNLYFLSLLAFCLLFSMPVFLRGVARMEMGATSPLPPALCIFLSVVLTPVNARLAHPWSPAIQPSRALEHEVCSGPWMGSKPLI